MQKHIPACPDARATEAWQIGNAGVPGCGSAPGTHPAYPTRRDLRVENAADEIAGHDMASAQTMRDALVAVTARVKALPFLCGSPCRGYDLPDVLALLADITPPCDAAYREQLAARAYEIARDAQNERERDAAEYRAELAREGE